METIRYSPIGKEDINFGTGTFEVTLADGRVVMLSQVDLGVILSTSGLATQTLTGLTLASPTLSGTITFSATPNFPTLTAKTMVYIDASNLLTSTAAPTNGQLLIGSTGAIPVLGTLTAGSGIGITNAAGSITIAAAARSYLAGYTLSTAGSSTTLTIAAGQCTNSTNTTSIGLASSINKTTGAWAVGTGNGGLDTGSIQSSTWYHVYAILRTDTGVVDVLFSTNASTPTLPANYTLFRRIGSAKTDGSSNWTAFIQQGDYFRWAASVLDQSGSVNPGTSAITQTVTVPTGVNVEAVSIFYIISTVVSTRLYVSDLSQTDEAPSASAAPLADLLVLSTAGANSTRVQIRTNTSAQFRWRLDTSDGNTNVRVATIGWVDRRGRDS